MTVQTLPLCGIVTSPRPPLITSVEFPPSEKVGTEPHRVRVSIHLPGEPSGEELRLIEGRLQRLSSLPMIEWSRWEWSPLGNGGVPAGMVVTAHGSGSKIGGAALRTGLRWLRALHSGEPIVRVISTLDVVPVLLRFRSPSGDPVGVSMRTPAGVWNVGIANDGERRLIMTRKD